MKPLITLTLFIVLSISHAQDYSRLKTIELRTEQDCIFNEKVSFDAANYLLSIAIDADFHNRKLLSSYLNKWVSVRFESGYHIDQISADLIGRNSDLLGVYLASITRASLTREYPVFQYDDVASEVKMIFYEYCALPENGVQLEHALIEEYQKLKVRRLPPIVESEIPTVPSILDARGLKQGLWRDTLQDVDEKVIGLFTYDAGVKNGPFQVYTESNLLICEGQYANDSIDGLVINYHLNGNVRLKRTYKNGAEHGSWYRFYEDGSPNECGYRESDSDIWYKWFYKNGVIRMYHYQDSLDPDVLHSFNYYDNGNVHFCNTKKNNRRHGTAIEYSRDGIEIKRTEYVNGEEVKKRMKD